MCNDNSKPRIIYFTFITPSEKFGGGIAVLQSIKSLCSFADVDYFGPSYDEEEFDNYKIRLMNKHILFPNNGKIRTIINFLTKGISTSFYESWKKEIQNIDCSHFDCCYMDFTRQSFVVKWANDNNIPIVIRAHNVEADYFASLFKKKPSLLAYVHKLIGRSSEKYCINNANRILVMTNNDKERFIELYDVPEQKTRFFPICVKHFNSDNSIDLPDKFICITGSLWFGPNADGVVWFLNNVWKELDKDITSDYALVIAGANPNRLILEISRELSNVHIYPNPKEIDSFYEKAFIYVAPIFYGAGMKVKIAEALSCGVPVITTSHSIAGYESIANEIFISDNPEEYIEEIERQIKLSSKEREHNKLHIIEVFEKNYSLSKSCELMNHYINEIIKNFK